MVNTGAMTLSDFMDALAAQESTPGGGGAAALTGSQAAALISMVINFTLGKKKYAHVQEAMETALAQSEGLRTELLALADRDVEAFEAVSACYGMPKKTPEEKATRTAALQTALKGAAEVPFVVAERCFEVMAMAEFIGAEGNVNVVSDAATALYLAYAGLKSALVNVNINLKFIKDEAFVAEWSAKRDGLLADVESTYISAAEACEATLGIEL
ncbi:MAG: cyclodeaminase/cyclohydrolase family protein [Chloroflexota bacterium]